MRRFCRVQVPPPTPPCTPEPQQVQGHHEQQRQYQQQQWQFAWQSRELCLHYFSNSVKFKFGQDTHDVYRVDQIKEWAELENPIWLDNLREKLFAIAGQFHSHMCQNELMQPGALKLVFCIPLVSTKFTQPPFLWSEFSQPLPSPSGQTSYVHTPKLGSFMALTNNNACILKVVFLVGQSADGEFQDAIKVKMTCRFTRVFMHLQGRAKKFLHV